MSTSSISILIDGNQETDVLPRTSELSAPLLENKYLYPEFAGFAGERLLKSILRKVLPMALCRTWEILTERQAPGNDVFLSVSRLCEEAERGERTIQLNLQELQARGLLQMRLERKLFVQTDGTIKPRLVVIKDFTALYALAAEYLEWMRSDGYIEPRREIFRYLMLEDLDEELRKKLLRFDNYRRLLLNKLPGPKIIERESHRWYTEYHSSSPENSGHLDAQQVYEQKKYQDPNLYLQKDLQKPLQENSQERKRTSDYSHRLDGDSFESDAPLGGEGGGQDYTKRPKVSSVPQVREEEIANAPTTNLANTNIPSVPVGKAGRAAARYESAECDPAVEMARRAMGAVGVAPGQKERVAGKRGSDGKPRPADNPVISSLLQEIVPVFGDQNPKASRTRALRLAQEYQLEGWELVACLVRAYVVTRDTKQVKRQDPRTGQPLRMPLFLKMLETFAQAWAAGTNWSYLQGDLEADIEADDRLSLWLGEQSFQNGREQPVQQDDLPTDDTLREPETPLKGPDADECASSTLQTQEGGEESCSMEAQEGWEAEEDRGQEECEETSQEDLSVPVLTVEHEEDGFSTFEDADTYGRWLREESGEMEYGHQVWGTQYGRWVILLYLHTAPLAETEVFLSRDIVRERLAELRQAKRERQRESMASRPVGRARRR